MFDLTKQIAIVTGGATVISADIDEAQGEDYLKQMTRAVTARTLGKPEDIGYAACFLASKEASFLGLILSHTETFLEIRERSAISETE